MSTVAEIKEAINKLNAEDRHLLVNELFADLTTDYENSPEFRAAIEESLADVEAGRVYTLDEVRILSDKWISESSSQKEL